jgi:nitroreductase
VKGFHVQDQTTSLERKATDVVSDLIKARYAGREVPRANTFPMLETMLAHRSVRAYLDDPVHPEDLSAAIAAAQSAATSSNLQAWSVIVVTDPERKSRLATLAANQAHIRKAPLLLVWLADLSRLRKASRLEDQPGDGLDYLELFLTGAIDAALASQNAQVAFEAMGYGTCYIGSMRSYPEEVAAELKLPPEVFPVFGMTIGREDPAKVTSVKPRLPRHSICFNESYDASAQETDLGDYNSAMRDFQTRQSMPLVSWTQKSSRRVATADSLKNRDQLKHCLRRMGFALK